MAKPRKSKSTDTGLQNVDRLAADAERVVAELSSKAADSPAARKLRERLEKITRTLASVSEKLDPTRRPTSVFSPSNPAHVGRFIALTLIAQHRVSFSDMAKFYGSGVYAIYYSGNFKAYKQISGTESPIYVGKADPVDDKAVSAVQQGTKLWNRLDEHKRSILKASNLDLGDFECRFLVVESGWQKAAEEYLIKLFQPVWNSEVRLVYGVGKHGDSAKTRVNRRSPWDTLHPGRKWAADTIADQKSVADIEAKLSEHFALAKPYKSQRDIFARFMEEMRQLPGAERIGDKGAK